MLEIGGRVHVEEEKNNPVDQSDAPIEGADEAVKSEAGQDQPVADQPGPVEATTDSGSEAAESDSAETEDNPSEEQAPEAPEAQADKPEDDKDSGTRNHKRVWRGIIAGFVLLLGGVASFLVLTNGDDEPVATEQPTVAIQEKVTTLGATVATVEGTVQFSNDGDTWVDAAGGESLAHLDYVRTLDSSRAIVLFDDGSVARLDSNTELYLSSLEAEGLEVTLMSGQVYSRVVESENTTFTVVTANERFEALGTAYKTATEGTKDELEVYQSDVKVKSADIDVTEGNKYDTETKEQSAIDLNELKDDEFAQWNKDRDLESDEFKDKLGVLDEKPEQEESDTSPNGQSNSDSSDTSGITLTAKQTDSGVKLSWTLSGVSSTNGFKVVRDKSDATPDYGEDDAQYVGADARSHTWWDDDGGTFYYRVCIYRDNGTCDTYSNAVQATSPEVEKEEVEEGDISLTIDGNTLSWSLVGGTAPHGFKVVLDDDEEPEYPEDSIKYVGADTTSVTLPEKPAGTYYVRVCKYTNDTQEQGCVDYSNEVEYVVSS